MALDKFSARALISSAGGPFHNIVGLWVLMCVNHHHHHKASADWPLMRDTVSVNMIERAYFSTRALTRSPLLSLAASLFPVPGTCEQWRLLWGVEYNTAQL